MVSTETTSEIPSSGGSDGHALESNTLIVVLGASGDLAKKKVSSRLYPLLSTTASARRVNPTRAYRAQSADRILVGSCARQR